MTEGYQALKLCRFSGVDYAVGDFVPSEAINTASVSAMLTMGFIAPAQPAQPDGETFPQEPEPPPEVETVVLPLITEEGTTIINIPPVDLYKVIETLQTRISDTGDILKSITSLDAMRLLERLETRKTLLPAIAEAAAALEQPQAGAGDPEQLDASGSPATPPTGKGSAAPTCTEDPPQPGADTPPAPISGEVPPQPGTETPLTTGSEPARPSGEGGGP